MSIKPGQVQLTQTVVVRTRDDRALITRPGAAKPETDLAYPLPPEVDALAQWAFDFRIGEDGLRMAVVYVRPKEYRIVQGAPAADVVVSSVAGYTITSPEQNHVHLEPATASVRAFANGIGHMIYRDVWFDPVTYLPTRVVLSGSLDTLDLTYRRVSGAWLLDHFTYATVVTGPRNAKRAYTIDATYRDYAFPDGAPGL
ncbi:MAG: hypothetical protein GIW95_08805 [Candidatus Eremiobacteraeota bacterium]|nr:hypothetical protein [Candidatus Eremiobacteraeota bacterium]